MEFEKIQGKTIRERVRQRIRQAILDGRIPPGQAMSLRNLAAQFGVSAMPIREALWQLESERIVVIDSSRSFRVNSLTHDQMIEILRVRKILETEAAKLACERCDDELLDKLNQIFIAMKRSSRNHSRYMRNNLEFHFTLYTHAESPLLFELINQLFARFGPYCLVHECSVDDLAERLSLHEEMLDALQLRDSKRLIKAVVEDAEHSTQVVLPYLEKNDRRAEPLVLPGLGSQ